MKTLAQILKIALTHLDDTGYVCHAVNRAWARDELEEEERSLALFEIGEMVGHSAGATIPIWLVIEGVKLHSDTNFTDLRHMVIGAWIDKLESLEEK